MNVDELVRELNPAPRESFGGRDSIELRAIFERSLNAPLRRRRRPVVVGGLTLGGFAAALGIALLVLSLLPGSPARPVSAAAATLAHLADVAAAQPATNPPGQGQFQYTESESLNHDCGYLSSGNFCYWVDDHRQIWLGADGSGRILETSSSPQFVTPVDQANWMKAGSPALGAGTSDTTFGPDTMQIGPTGFANLPTDPTTLGQELSARKIEGGPPGPAEDFIQIGDLLRETDASPALRSAIYQVAETIPGVVALGTVQDHAGRSGVGIGRVSDGIESEYIFDPTTSVLMSEQQVAVVANAANEGESVGALLGWTVYLSSGIVSSLSNTPTGAAPPAPPVSCTAVPDHPGESHCNPGS